MIRLRKTTTGAGDFVEYDVLDVQPHAPGARWGTAKRLGCVARFERRWSCWLAVEDCSDQLASGALYRTRRDAVAVIEELTRHTREMT